MRRSGGRVGEGVRQVLVDHLLSGILTTSATGTESTTFCQMSDMSGAIFNGFADVLVGDGFTEADVHLVGLSSDSQFCSMA